MFPKSLCRYVERAFDLCKDDTQRVACQAIMKEASCTVYKLFWHHLLPLKCATSYAHFPFFALFFPLWHGIKLGIDYMALVITSRIHSFCHVTNRLSTSCLTWSKYMLFNAYGQQQRSYHS